MLLNGVVPFVVMLPPVNSASVPTVEAGLVAVVTENTPRLDESLKKLKRLENEPAAALVVSNSILLGLLTASVTVAVVVPLVPPVVPIVTAALAAEAAVRAVAPASAIKSLRIEIFLPAFTKDTNGS